MPDARRDLSCFRVAWELFNSSVHQPDAGCTPALAQCVRTSRPSAPRYNCSRQPGQGKSRPNPAGPPAHAVIKYLSAALHETPNRSPVMASHNHEPDRAPHLLKYITQDADCGGQGGAVLVPTLAGDTKRSLPTSPPNIRSFVSMLPYGLLPTGADGAETIGLRNITKIDQDSLPKPCLASNHGGKPDVS